MGRDRGEVVMALPAAPPKPDLGDRLLFILEESPYLSLPKAGSVCNGWLSPPLIRAMEELALSGRHEGLILVYLMGCGGVA